MDPNLHLPQKPPDNTYCPRPKYKQESCLVVETSFNEGNVKIALNFDKHPDFDYGQRVKNEKYLEQNIFKLLLL